MRSQPERIRAALNHPKLSLLQYTTLLICFLLTVLVGMDVLVIAFAAPAISASWEIRPESLGVVFSGALAGITVGALLLAPLADRAGRKSMILACTTLMGASVLATAWAQSVGALIALRVVTGLGIGGLLVTATTLASEYAPERSKDFWVSLILAGYPVGAVLSGVVAAELTQDAAWRTMFRITGWATLCAVPLVVLLVSESLEFLVSCKQKHALRRANAILTRLKAPTLQTLPDAGRAESTASVWTLFTGTRRTSTVLLWIAFFMTFATLYFLLSWIPKLTTDAGMPRALGIYSGTVFNVGAFFGIVASGALALQLGLQRTILVFLACAALMMALFSLFSGSVMVLVMFGLIGFAIQGGFVGLYAVAARLYPAVVRSTGIGWSMGIGRIGAVLGPIAAGLLVAAGATLTTNFIVFAVPCLIAGLATLAIRT